MDGTTTPRPRLRALLAAALLALALLCAAASAARADDEPGLPVSAPATQWPAGGSTLHQLLAMGTDFWAMTPCGGKVSITWGTLDQGINAQSSWVNPAGDYAQPSTNRDCDVVLSTGTWWDWDKLCTVVIHELGHLTGHDHVADPTNIMYYAYVQPAQVCLDTPEPVETGPPPAAAAAPRAAAPVARPAKAKAKVKATARRRTRAAARRAARRR